MKNGNNIKQNSTVITHNTSVRNHNAFMRKIPSILNCISFCFITLCSVVYGFITFFEYWFYCIISMKIYYIYTRVYILSYVPPYMKITTCMYLWLYYCVFFRSTNYWYETSPGCFIFILTNWNNHKARLGDELWFTLPHRCIG